MAHESRSVRVVRLWPRNSDADIVGYVTSSTPSARSVLRYAARRAILAPSVHNTQPWTFVLTGDALEVHRDVRRQLDVLDPRGRQLLISCGCALLHARVAIESTGHEPLVQRFPDPDRLELVARVQVGELRQFAESPALDDAIDQRHTNRRAFLGDVVPEDLVRALARHAFAEGAVLVPMITAQQRSAVIRMTALADELERSDPAYIEEIVQWTTDDTRRADAVPASSVPYAGAVRAEPGMIRRFDVRGCGWLPCDGATPSRESLLMLCSRDDGPRDWLRVGEALERIWLILTAYGFWASPLVQPIEVAVTNAQLRAELGLTAHPQVLLRAGHAPDVAPTRRRRPADVIVDRTN